MRYAHRSYRDDLLFWTEFGFVAVALLVTAVIVIVFSPAAR
jgi:hypothetical protein